MVDLSYTISCCVLGDSVILCVQKEALQSSSESTARKEPDQSLTPADW